MARLLWLPSVLRAAGLTVYEVPGWQTRGSDKLGGIVGVTCHATAGSRTSSVAGEISVLINGSTSAPPPIAQLLVARGTGDWHVVASGLCYHNLIGWAGPNEGYGNSNLVGVEAMNDNKGEPWAPAMLDSYQRGVAAICDHLGISAARVAGHKEHQPGSKTDPVGIDMTAFRARVAQLIVSGGDDMFSDEDRRTLLNVQGRAVEVYAIKAKLDTLLAAAGEEVQRDAAEAARDAVLLAEVDQAEEMLANIPGADPAAWADAVVQRLLPHLPTGGDPQAYLDALRDRLAS